MPSSDRSSIGRAFETLAIAPSHADRLSLLLPQTPFLVVVLSHASFPALRLEIFSFSAFSASAISFLALSVTTMLNVFLLRFFHFLNWWRRFFLARRSFKKDSWILFSAYLRLSPVSRLQKPPGSVVNFGSCNFFYVMLDIVMYLGIKRPENSCLTLIKVKFFVNKEKPWKSTSAPALWPRRDSFREFADYPARQISAKINNSELGTFGIFECFQ